MEYEIKELVDASLVRIFNNALVLTSTALRMRKQNL